MTLERELAPAESVAWMERKWQAGPRSLSSLASVLNIPLTLFTEKRSVSPAERTTHGLGLICTLIGTVPATMEKTTPRFPRRPLSLSVTLKSVNTVPGATPSEMDTEVTGFRNVGVWSLKSSTVILISASPVDPRHISYNCILLGYIGAGN